jgi:hypothetical protein
LGPIADRSVIQRGEAWREVASPFVLVDRPELQRLRNPPAGALHS